MTNDKGTMNNVAELSLEMFRDQIDDVDQSIIEALSQGAEGEDCLDIILELTDEDKEMLRSTRLRFSQKVCKLLQKRMDISKNIGYVKRLGGRMSMVDEERKKMMIDSRVEWSSNEFKTQVRTLYNIIHDISVRIQKEGKNLL